jgi:formylglycine-generating enzyme required for sulfatase activity
MRSPWRIATFLGALAGLANTGQATAENPPARIISTTDGAELVLVPAGEFLQGQDQRTLTTLLVKMHEPKDSWYKTEMPPRRDTLPAYYIDRFEVTNEQYARFLSSHPKVPRPRWWANPQWNLSRQPVVGVGWKDATAYATWAGKRLPSEAEWEKAARGTDGRVWPWGNVPDASRYNGRPQGRFLPALVGSFSPPGDSVYGVADLAGNVWEMTAGMWDQDSHAMRGGSFLNSNGGVRSTVRWAASTDNETNGARWLGFRCVMDVSVATTRAHALTVGRK